MIRQQLIDRGIHDSQFWRRSGRCLASSFSRRTFASRPTRTRPRPSGTGRRISQPYIVGVDEPHLKVSKEHKVLEIGTGSGYQTAILAQLAARFYTVERVKPLLDEAFERLMSLDIGNVHLHYGTGRWVEKNAPYDRF